MQILANFVGILKSACLTKTKTAIIPYNNTVLKLCNMLYDTGYIYGYTILSNYKLKLFLKFSNNKSAIRNISLMSKSSVRVYLKKKNLTGKNILAFTRGLNFIILSSSVDKRLLTDVEAFMLNSGGEPVCVIS